MTEKQHGDPVDPGSRDPKEANEEQQGRDVGSGGAGGGKEEQDLPTSDEGNPYQPDPLGNPGGPEREEHL